MSANFMWAAGLGISKDTILQWKQQAGASDLLRWALSNGKIPEAKYLDWAKNYYQLPCLEQSFFDQSPDPQLWEKWGAKDWSGSFLPIYEWDAVLYIACLEPPTAEQATVLEQLGTRVNMLLAPLTGMKKWWHILSPELNTRKELPPHLAKYASQPGERNELDKKVDPIPVEVPTPPVRVSAPVLETKKTVEKPVPVTAVISAELEEEESHTRVIKIDERAVGESIVTPAAPTAEQEESSFEFDLSSTANSNASSSDNSDPFGSLLGDLGDVEAQEASDLFSAPEADNVPAGLEMDMNAFSTDNSDEFSGFAEPENSLSLEVPEGLTGVQEAQQEVSGFDIDSLDLGIDLQTPSAPSNNMSEESVILPAPGAVKAEEQQGKDLDDNFRMIALEAMNRFAKIFDKSMVLIMERSSLNASLWTQNWNYNKNASTKIDLSMNSIFRIVNNTRLPYHGYVVKNPINDSFFSAFNGAVLPEHCTIVPVLFNNNLVAMVLGVCSSEKATGVDLSECEEIANDMSRLLLQSQRQAASMSAA